MQPQSYAHTFLFFTIIYMLGHCERLGEIQPKVNLVLQNYETNSLHERQPIG